MICMARAHPTIKVINTNKTTKDEAKQKIKLLSDYLSKNWYAPLEKQSNDCFSLFYKGYKTLIPFTIRWS